MSYTGSVPDTTSRESDWRDLAACRQEDPSLFFPDGSAGPWLLVIEQAKSVCRRCPVVDRCLEWALKTRQESGIWGGLSEDERQVLRRRTARRPAPDPSRLEVYAAVYRENTKPADGGHLLWIGNAPTVKVDGKYVPYARLAFEVGAGQPPYGPVKTDCDRYRCVAPEHLTDATTRAARKAAV